MKFSWPKPLHGWRAFFGEVGVVLIGVLLALGAQQVADDIHWNTQTAEAREALKAELDHDLGTMTFRVAEQDCVDRRLNAVDSWVASWRAGRPITLTDDIHGISFYHVRSSVWDIVKSGQTAAQMPLDDQLDYARLYDVLMNLDRFQAQELDAWGTLNEFNGAHQLSDADLRLIHKQVLSIRSMSGNYVVNLHGLAETAARLGLKPDTLEMPDSAAQARFCGNILPAVAGVAR
ncbi:hypothetical protein HZF05_20670 [Sphingomonas sp. CGMCC 1.13654]|uniref:Uncharacterized protein n=1 Tax=Sphingomonas chungangi TaxID=2683589 RepID=A0A838LCB1_9SPHN|nr:hypothetical protein [Sphingomonas chungangi]MBA2936502.1 hypothetical protein [Sphingomonas chungangi]MVW55887.1 hypothetical protein [Sphingomonas chungangi]